MLRSLFLFYVAFCLLKAITKVTESNTKNKPSADIQSKYSPKNNVPTNTATTGSIEPRMEVIVDPACLTANTKHKSEINVAKNPNKIKFIQSAFRVIASIPVVNKA